MSYQYPPQQPPGYPPQGGYPPQQQQQQQQYMQQQQMQQQQQQQDPYAAQAMASAPVIGNQQRIQEAIGQVDMLAGEQVVYAIQADGFFLGSNPMLKAIAKFQAMLTTITGGHIRIFLVVTNHRVLVIRSIQFMCGCQRVKSVHAIALAGIKECGSTRETQACCIHTRAIFVQSMTQTFQLVVKKMNDQDIRSFVTNLSNVIVAHTGKASV